MDINHARVSKLIIGLDAAALLALAAAAAEGYNHPIFWIEWVAFNLLALLLAFGRSPGPRNFHGTLGPDAGVFAPYEYENARSFKDNPRYFKNAPKLDEEEIAQAVADYSRYILHYAYKCHATVVARTMRQCEAFSALDYAGDLFAHAYEAMTKWQDPTTPSHAACSLTTYLQVCLHNKVFDLIKRDVRRFYSLMPFSEEHHAEQVRRGAKTNHGEEEDERVPDSASIVDVSKDDTSAMFSSELITRTVLKLPAQERAIINMRFLRCSMSRDEIGKRLKLTGNQVAYEEKKILAKLKEVFEASGE